MNRTILITGAAGFIGFHVAKALLEQDKDIAVIGYDNVNDYYDPSLKEDRLRLLAPYANFTFIRADLADKDKVDETFKTYRPSIVLNLAAQAGVRYSITNPDAYIQSNIIGFYNILEACRHSLKGEVPVEHLVYASSSSVYGLNSKVPFSTEDKVDQPVSLYAATKKSNELLAHAYTHLYHFPTTGLRFFTVYGPWGRPDMAYFKFTNRIVKGEPVQIYNYGDMWRDFTYIDDIVKGILSILPHPPVANSNGGRYKVYNIGNNKPEKIMDYFKVLEDSLEMKMKVEFLPMQPGDVYKTYADVDDLIKDFGFKPSTTIEEGLAKFVAWYKEYYHYPCK
ncbi:MAG: NAD-dependent epimerase/dehydratase family protein [Spirochaetia bacterium]|jgi:UDP-glucuronate 4-epimerase|nr:NAD-dependent epimerase/dehydratase family protein [Spirochaetia bacterium]